MNFFQEKKYHEVRIDDFRSERIIDHFEGSNNFILQCKNEGKKCLVHCMAGKIKIIN